jgi:hypothetical protein
MYVAVHPARPRARRPRRRQQSSVSMPEPGGSLEAQIICARSPAEGCALCSQSGSSSPRIMDHGSTSGVTADQRPVYVKKSRKLESSLYEYRYQLLQL